MGLVKRYIPKKVYEKLEIVDFKKKEHLYILIDMICRMGVYRKEKRVYNDYVDIPRERFKDLIPTYKPLINYLKDNNFIECDECYSKDEGKALGYRIPEKLLSVNVEVEITNKVLSRKIISHRNHRKSFVEDKLKSSRNFFFDTFTLDFEAAKNHLENWRIQEHSRCGDMRSYINMIRTYNHILMSLVMIEEGDIFFRRNKTNNRIDTNLTTLKSEYKRFIKRKGLWQIDIVNSQPFFLGLYLQEAENKKQVDCNELRKYMDWTSGGFFYEKFMDEYNKRTYKSLSRDEVKNMMFCVYYSQNGNFTKQKEMFRTFFPTIMDFIENEKKVKHNQFAIKLQKLESSFCIDDVCMELDRIGVNYYTIHDAWLVDRDDVVRTRTLIETRFYLLYGVKPLIKIEAIN